MQINADRLSEYIHGMQKQREDAIRALAMIEGAIQFANQLLEEIESGGESTPPETEPNS